MVFESCYRNHPSLVRVVGIAAILLGGTGVGVVAVAHALGADEPVAGILLSVCVVVAATVPSYVVAGWLFHRAYDARDVSRVISWSLLGGVPLAALVVVVAVYQRAHGVVIHDLAFVVTSVAGVGFVGGALTGIHDVERARRESDYHAVDDQFRTVIGAAPVGIVAVDDDGRVQLWNDAATALFGYDADAVVGAPCPIAPLDEPDDCTVTDPSEWPREFDCHRADGSRVAVECRTAELTDESAADCRYVAILSDVTAEQHRRQRLTVLHRVLRHNLRTAITVAQGHAQRLADAATTARNRRSADAILDVTADLADLSEKAGRVERTLGQTGDPSPLDLAALVRRRAADARDRFPAAAIRVDAPDAAWVRAGPGVGTALAEAIENAVEHNDAADPVVAVDVTVDGTGTTTVTVADNGPGIPESERAAVEGGRETATRHVTGLGLWLLAWTVRGAGGTVDFAENDPRGTAVTMTLPTATPPADQDAPSTPPTQRADGATPEPTPARSEPQP